MSSRLPSYTMWRVGFAIVVLVVAVGCGSLRFRCHRPPSSGSTSISTLDPLGHLEESGAGTALQDVVVTYITGEIRGNFDCDVFGAENDHACARGYLLTGQLLNADVTIGRAEVFADRGFAWIELVVDNGERECFFQMKRETSTHGRWTVFSRVMCFPVGADP